MAEFLLSSPLSLGTRLPDNSQEVTKQMESFQLQDSVEDPDEQQWQSPSSCLLSQISDQYHIEKNRRGGEKNSTGLHF